MISFGGSDKLNDPVAMLRIGFESQMVSAALTGLLSQPKLETHGSDARELAETAMSIGMETARQFIVKQGLEEDS